MIAAGWNPKRVGRIFTQRLKRRTSGVAGALDRGDCTVVSPGADARWTLEILLGILASQNGHNHVDLPLPRSGS